jgi:hypothetical protein
MEETSTGWAYVRQVFEKPAALVQQLHVHPCGRIFASFDENGDDRGPV